MGRYELPFLIFCGNLFAAFGDGLQHAFTNPCRFADVFDMVVKLLVADGEGDAAIPVPNLTKHWVDGDCHVIVCLLLLNDDEVALNVFGAQTNDVRETQSRPTLQQEKVSDFREVGVS